MSTIGVNIIYVIRHLLPVTYGLTDMFFRCTLRRMGEKPMTVAEMARMGASQEPRLTAGLRSGPGVGKGAGRGSLIKKPLPG